MIVQLLTEHHLEFLSLKAGCRGSSESTLVKMSNCWKSHAAAQMDSFRLRCISISEHLSKFRKQTFYYSLCSEILVEIPGFISVSKLTF